MKSTVISIIIAGLVISGAIILSKNISNNGQYSNTRNTNNETTNASNVSIVDGKQIIEINVKGGYSPIKSIAKAGISTTLRFNTRGTFDCSSYIRIPSKNILQSLPQTGTTDIDLGTTTVGIIGGTCGMGMYPFQVEFK